MNKRAYLVISLLLLVALAEGVWIWQFAPAPTTAGLAVDATNAGIEIDADDGRVFVHAHARAGDVVAQGPLGQVLSLDPGKYDARVVVNKASDGQSIWLRGIELAAGQKISRSVEFDYGEINVESTAGAEDGKVVAYVFPHDNRDQVVTSTPAGAPVLVAPGVYDVRVVLVQNSEEADIRWHDDVPVKPGLQTRINVQFQRGSLLIEAYNGELALPDGAVELAVYRAGDDARERVLDGLAGTPLNLAAGRYDIAATFVGSHDRPVKWLRDLAIETGTDHRQRIAFESGTVEITARLAGGEALERFQSYAYFYPAGEHREAIAYVTPPDPAVLASGRYDVRVNFHRSQDRPDVWIRGLQLPAGARIARSVEFPSGRLLLRAFDAEGNELYGDSVFVYVHAHGARERPVTVARSGQILTLLAGDYDLRVEASARPGEPRWLEKVSILPGRLIEPAIEFDAVTQ